MASTEEMIQTLGLPKVTSVTTPALDNGGEDCTYCSTEGAVIDTQIYYTLDGEPIFEDGCNACMLVRIFESAQLGADNFQVETEAK